MTLTPDLASKVTPGSVVFVFALAPEGGGPPLAVFRAPANEFPLAFRLDDSMAMNQAQKISNTARVVITARLSKSGNVTVQPGDLEGPSSPVAPGASGVAVRIDKER